VRDRRSFLEHKAGERVESELDDLVAAGDPQGEWLADAGAIERPDFVFLRIAKFGFGEAADDLS